MSNRCLYRLDLLGVEVFDPGGDVSAERQIRSSLYDSAATYPSEIDWQWLFLLENLQILALPAVRDFPWVDISRLSELEVLLVPDSSIGEQLSWGYALSQLQYMPQLRLLDMVGVPTEALEATWEDLPCPTGLVIRLDREERAALEATASNLEDLGCLLLWIDREDV